MSISPLQQYIPHIMLPLNCPPLLSFPSVFTSIHVFLSLSFSPLHPLINSLSLSPSPSRIENAKIMIANTPMDTDKIKIYGSRVSTTCYAILCHLSQYVQCCLFCQCMCCIMLCVMSRKQLHSEKLTYLNRRILPCIIYSLSALPHSAS